VTLEQHEDFSKWGLTVWVKFRQEDVLHQLNAHTQSGGERSVSTMLYLISLQDLTDCPFRLVDEINQGMDPRNERMIFQQVVDCACRPGLPQYFLITPKLLPDLHFTPEITVLCVLNGPWQIPQSEWRVDDFLRKKKAGRIDRFSQLLRPVTLFYFLRFHQEHHSFVALCVAMTPFLHFC